jgi:hypothetical protein
MRENESRPRSSAPIQFFAVGPEKASATAMALGSNGARIGAAKQIPKIRRIRKPENE